MLKHYSYSISHVLAKTWPNHKNDFFSPDIFNERTSISVVQMSNILSTDLLKLLMVVLLSLLLLSLMMVQLSLMVVLLLSLLNRLETDTFAATARNETETDL